MTATEIIAANVEMLDEGAGRPASHPIDQFLDPAIAARWARDAEQRHQKWVESIKEKKLSEVFEAVPTRNSALLIWIDSNNELRARRVSRETSVIRDFVPNYLLRNRHACD